MAERWIMESHFSKPIQERLRGMTSIFLSFLRKESRFVPMKPEEPVTPMVSNLVLLFVQGSIASPAYVTKDRCCWNKNHSLKIRCMLHSQ